MSEKITYLTAFVAAAAIFAGTGGIHASERAAEAVEKPVMKPAFVAGVDTSIPFADSGSIRDWRADGLEAIFVQDLRGSWYRAELIGPCFDLNTAQTIAFDTGPSGHLDKFGSVVVRGQRCAFTTFVTSAPPPASKNAKAKHAAG